MAPYLEAMERAVFVGPRPAQGPPVVIAALRPKMLELAGRRAKGAHPYLVPPAHTRRAREIRGRGPRRRGAAGRRAKGAHASLVPPEHARRAREILGRRPLLLPEQKVLLE